MRISDWSSDVCSADLAAGPGAKQLADMLGMTYRQEPLSSMRKVIAKRLTESKQQVPHFYLTVDCRIDELLDFRKRLNSQIGRASGRERVGQYVENPGVAGAIKKKKTVKKNQQN